jgi:dTDP-4-dehydrorhamnose 3,5-epimerase
MIQDVQVKLLKTHRSADKSEFTEIIRHSDTFFTEGFAQLNHVTMYGRGTIKAWHICQTQEEWWYVPVGNLAVKLIDIRKNSPTYKNEMIITLGDSYPPKVLKVPHGIVHGCKSIYFVTHLIYIASKEYDEHEELKFKLKDDFNFYWDEWEKIKKGVNI